MSNTTREIGIVALFVVAVMAAHGGSLDDGLFYDDHWHIKGLDDPSWSYDSLAGATDIVPTRFVDQWWQDMSVYWQYPRPFSFLVSKIVYTLTDRSVMALHALNIVLHLINVRLIYRLCYLLTRRRFWSAVGGLSFAVYSHSIYAVGWLASQSSVLQATMLLSAVLGYVRASGLQLCPHANGDAPTGDTPVRFNVKWFIVVMLCWIGGLLSRETAIMFPLPAVGLDAAFGGRKLMRARAGAYVAMLLIAGAFVCYRVVLIDHRIPDFYLRRPDGPSYGLWLVAKLLHYTTAVIFQSPLMFGPTLRRNPAAEVPWDCLLMLGIVGFMAWGYFRAMRRAPGWWIWPGWILLSILPIVPLMATPHSGYLPGVGFVICVAVAAGLRDRLQPRGIGRWSRGVAIFFLVAMTSYVPIYRAMWGSVIAAERLTLAEIQRDPPEPAVTDVYLINLPFANAYVQCHLAERLQDGGDEQRTNDTIDKRCHVLTYASNVLKSEQTCELRQLDAYRFRLRATDRAFFSGPMGRFLIESMRSEGIFHEHERIDGPLFDVRIVESEPCGVRELEFAFHEPLASEQSAFYMSTPDRAAVRVWFGHGDAGTVAFNRADDDSELQQMRQQRDRLFRIRDVASRIIRTDLYFTGPAYPGPR